MICKLRNFVRFSTTAKHSSEFQEQIERSLFLKDHFCLFSIHLECVRPWIELHVTAPKKLTFYYYYCRDSTLTEYTRIFFPKFMHSPPIAGGEHCFSGPWPARPLFVNTYPACAISVPSEAILMTLNINTRHLTRHC